MQSILRWIQCEKPFLSFAHVWFIHDEHFRAWPSTERENTHTHNPTKWFLGTEQRENTAPVLSSLFYPSIFTSWCFFSFSPSSIKSIFRSYFIRSNLKRGNLFFFNEVVLIQFQGRISKFPSWICVQRSECKKIQFRYCSLFSGWWKPVFFIATIK